MILPTKHLSADRSLLYIGAQILRSLDQPKTISRLWHELKSRENKSLRSMHLTSYDWFMLALDLLFTINAITLKKGKLYKAQA